MTQAEIIILAPLCIVAMAAGFWKLHQIKGTVKHAKIIEEDGRMREPTNDERIAIAADMSHKTSKHFPVLVIVGILLVAVVWVTLKLCGLIPVSQ